MKKILFIIRKTSESAYQDCVESIKALKIPSLYSVECIYYSTSDVCTASDVYVALCQNKKPDISIIIDDTVLLADDNLLRKIIKIFLSDSSIGVIGIKGAEVMPDSGLLDEASVVYGGLYEMNSRREVFAKRYNDVQSDYMQVEAVSSTFLAVRGYIPVWSGINSRCIGEILSVAAAVQGYKVVVSNNDTFWCFSTIPESKPSAEDLRVIKDKYKFKDILFSQKHCLLTIGIPTFNRSKYFSKCIRNLYRFVGNMPWIEIFVSNNDSTDDTEEIASRYFKHRNFRYYKQPVNIVGKNFDYLYENAKGDFVVACGDDDYYSGEVILSLLEAICLYPDSSVIELDWPACYTPSSIHHGRGMDSFLVECTRLYTCISCIVLNSKRYREIGVKDRFAHTHLNQCYVQLEMLRNHPDYALVHGNNFLPESGEATGGRKFARNERYPFCDIFIREYYPILDYFLDKGLSRDAYEKEKAINLSKVLAWLHAINSAGDFIQWLIDDDIEELMEEFYGYEPYYASLKQEIKGIAEKRDLGVGDIDGKEANA